MSSNVYRIDVIREFPGKTMHSGIYLYLLFAQFWWALRKSIKAIIIQSPDNLSLHQAMLPIQGRSKFDFVILLLSRVSGFWLNATALYVLC